MATDRMDALDAAAWRDHAVVAASLIRWYDGHGRDLPWRRSRDPYAIWVSEVMLQQTQVRTVIPYWERWMTALPDLEALAQADETEVLKLWEGLGYYRRARHLQAAARVIRDRHLGRFPSDFDSVLELPGIGRYTAGAICSIAFDQPTPILDGNVARVLTRCLALDGDPADRDVQRRLWTTARDLVEAAAALRRNEACSRLNQALMELGAIVCTPKDPRCAVCPIAGSCQARRLGKAREYPRARRRPATAVRHFVVLVARHRGRYLVRRRSDGELNGGLWEFPNAEVGVPAADPRRWIRRWFGRAGAPPAPWMTVRHAITRFRIEQRIFLWEPGRVVTASRRAPGMVWRTLDELEALPFPSAHRRVVTALRAQDEAARDDDA